MKAIHQSMLTVMALVVLVMIVGPPAPIANLAHFAFWLLWSQASRVVCGAVENRWMEGVRWFCYTIEALLVAERLLGVVGVDFFELL